MDKKMKITHLPSPKKEKKLTKSPHIHPSATVVDCSLGEYTDIGPNCKMYESEMGAYSYLAGDVSVIWSSIGNFCSIASHCCINPGNHPYWRVTQNHCTYRKKQYGFATEDDSEFFHWRKENAAHLGHDVWLGHGVYIMAGAHIGTGAVIAAGSVVTKTHPIEPYAIAVGSPAKAIKKRFSDKIIEQLLEIGYWYWSYEKLQENLKYFYNIEKFLERFN